MTRTILSTACVVMFALLMTQSASAQPRGGAPNANSNQEQGPPLPSDPRLITLHKKFVADAEKLAAEYERTGQLDKAKDCYGEIVKLVPQYTAARAKYEDLMNKIAASNLTQVTVKANEGWQNTGIIVLEGKPVHIRASGKWTFTLTAELGPEGMQIPKELQDFKLGCLMGVIDTGNSKEMKPFVVGPQKSFEAKQNGRLLLQMYDIHPQDNEGQLAVEISGEFQRSSR